ncbi:hypothetical protein OFY17_06830 [Marinomonas sp. C2222]|uniref:Lipoprotein n=1 Tax=Marinomonas sargassi TaxID=2984494 RepID=A0ABT2YRU0_9GAMM|nr:hypothetical protein [Marinomonas sargassi]MCV2402607.1 hypothetical protein [Marinomonas sargassi]
MQAIKRISLSVLLVTLVVGLTACAHPRHGGGGGHGGGGAPSSSR